ncbi:MAG TPA: TolC family protein [Rhizobacter sp.]|nr:TolC family protein [Rhizobacter sp.]
MNSSLSRALVALLAAGALLPAQAKCVDEENVELRANSNTNGAPVDAGTARINLQNMVNEALRRSQAIGAAKLLAEAAAIDVDEARAGHWPQLTANGFIGGTQNRLTDVEDVSGKQGRAGLTLTAPLFDAGRTSNLTDWRKNLAESARLGEINTQEQVALQTVSLAIERARYRLQAQVYQQYSRKMSCLVEALDTIVRADRGRASELVQAQKTQQQAEISQNQTLSMVRQIETRLRRFVGDTLPPADGLSSLLLSPPPLSELVSEAEGAVDIAQLAAQAQAADAYAKSVSASRWPVVSLLANGNQTRGVGNSTNWAAGINVNVPLFNLPLGYQVDSAEKRAAAARLQREDALEARRFRMAEVHEQASASFDRARSVVNVLRDSDRLRNYTLQQWQQLGRRSLFDVMGAESEHYNLRVAYVNALYDGQQSTALLWSLGLGVRPRLN